MTRARRTSRKARLDIMGAAIVAACGLAALAFGSAAVALDAERGLTVSESLCTAGLGCTAERRAEIRAELRGAERPAVPARLIGDCGGRIMAAEHESAFPAGCAWIVPAGAPLVFAELGDAEAAAATVESCVAIARRPDGWTLESC